MNTIHCDGAGWNGQKSEYCIIKNEEPPIRKTINQKMTNNEMEYLAIIKALEIAQPNDTIITDSQLIEQQIKGNYQIKAQNLRELHQRAQELYLNKQVKITWKPRNQNKAGKTLEKK